MKNQATKLLWKNYLLISPLLWSNNPEAERPATKPIIAPGTSWLTIVSPYSTPRIKEAIGAYLTGIPEYFKTSTSPRMTGIDPASCGESSKFMVCTRYNNSTKDIICLFIASLFCGGGVAEASLLSLRMTSSHQLFISSLSAAI